VLFRSREAFVAAPVVGSGPKRHVPRGVVRAWRRLKYHFIAERQGAHIEMFGIARAEVERLVARAQGTLLEAKEDNSHGTLGTGFEYWVTKAPRRAVAP